MSIPHRVVHYPGAPHHLLCAMYAYYLKAVACQLRGHRLSRRHPRKDRMAFDVGPDGKLRNNPHRGKWRRLTSRYNAGDKYNRMFGRLCERLRPWEVLSEPVPEEKPC